MDRTFYRIEHSLFIFANTSFSVFLLKYGLHQVLCCFYCICARWDPSVDAVVPYMYADDTVILTAGNLKLS